MITVHFKDGRPPVSRNQWYMFEVTDKVVRLKDADKDLLGVFSAPDVLGVHFGLPGQSQKPQPLSEIPA